MQQMRGQLDAIRLPWLPLLLPLDQSNPLGLLPVSFCFDLSISFRFDRYLMLAAIDNEKCNVFICSANINILCIFWALLTFAGRNHRICGSFAHNANAIAIQGRVDVAVQCDFRRGCCRPPQCCGCGRRLCCRRTRHYTERNIGVHEW